MYIHSYVILVYVKYEHLIRAQVFKFFSYFFNEVQTPNELTSRACYKCAYIDSSHLPCPQIYLEPGVMRSTPTKMSRISKDSPRMSLLCKGQG